MTVDDKDSYSFAPYQVDVISDFEGLKTKINISRKHTFGIKQVKKVVLHALIGLPIADVPADRLFVDTANSEHRDAASLICYQLSTGEELWRVTDVQPGGRIEINTKEQWVTAGKPYGTSDDYIVCVGYEGNVLRRNPRSCYEIVDLAKARLDAGDTVSAQALFMQALETEISPNTKASVCRSLGEIVEKMGNTEAAIQYYTRALELNPKVGVKKRLDALKQG